MRKILPPLVLCLFILTAVLAQAQSSFVTFGGSANEQGTGIEFQSNGTALCFGMQSDGPNGGWDLTLHRLALDGTVSESYFMGSAANEYVKRIIRKDNFLYYAGFSQESGSLESRGVVWKISEDGVIVDQFELEDPGYFVVFNSITLLDDGGFAVAGYRKQNVDTDPLICRFDALGNLIWDQLYPSAEVDYLMGIAESADGDLITTGDRYIAADSIYNSFFLKTDATGVLVSDTLLLHEGNGGVRQLIATSDGDFLAAGESSPVAGEPFDFYLIKVSEDLELRWQSWTGTEDPEACFDIAERLDGYAATGYGSDRFGNTQIVLGYINALGEVDSFSYYGNSSVDIGQGIAVSGERIAIAGQVFNSENDFGVVLETFGVNGLNVPPQLQLPNVLDRGSSYTLSFNHAFELKDLNGTQIVKILAGEALNIPADIAPGYYLLRAEGYRRSYKVLIR